MGNDTRWLQRLDSYSRAVILLREVRDMGVATLSVLEKQGVVKRYEIAIELAWKVLKDYLEAQQVLLTPPSPKNTLQEAFALGLIHDNKLWAKMLEERNAVAHEYNEDGFLLLAELSIDKYLPKFEELLSVLNQLRET